MTCFRDEQRTPHDTVTGNIGPHCPYVNYRNACCVTISGSICAATYSGGTGKAMSF
jgi:hypothetical protein